jgi:hypothetical protein
MPSGGCPNNLLISGAKRCQRFSASRTSLNVSSACARALEASPARGLFQNKGSQFLILSIKSGVSDFTSLTPITSLDGNLIMPTLLLQVKQAGDEAYGDTGTLLYALLAEGYNSSFGIGEDHQRSRKSDQVMKLF